MDDRSFTSAITVIVDAAVKLRDAGVTAVLIAIIIVLLVVIYRQSCRFSELTGRVTDALVVNAKETAVHTVAVNENTQAARASTEAARENAAVWKAVLEQFGAKT